MKTTGLGTTITLATTGAVGCVREMQLPEWLMEKVDATCLDSTDWMEFIPGNITDPGEAVLTVALDPETGPVDGGTVELVTINLPISNPTNTVAATISGTGFISSRALGTAGINTLLEYTVTIVFDGGTNSGTPPTFTNESAT